MISLRALTLFIVTVFVAAPAWADPNPNPDSVSVTTTTTTGTPVSIPADTVPESACDPYPDITVNINQRFDDPVYDFNTGLAGIQQLASDTQHSIHETITMGLTRYVPMLEFGIPIRELQFPDGLACARVEHVDVTFGYKDVTVYVANEIPQGTCGFDQIVAHEQKHINVNREILDEYAPLIQRQLKDYLRDNGVFRETDMKYAADLLDQKLQTILNQIIVQITADNIARQQEVDSPAEYQRITESCNGQLMNIAHRFQVGR